MAKPGRKRGVNSPSGSKIAIMLRQPHHLVAFKEAMERMAMARGGEPIDATEFVYNLSLLYLENSDNIDPVSEKMRDLYNLRKEMEKKAAGTPAGV